MKTIEYYLMRHASYYDQENQYVTYRGMITLKSYIDDLKAEIQEKFPNKKLRILHSTLPRAIHTAFLIKEMLTDIQVTLQADSRLISDNLQIDSTYVTEAVCFCELNNEVMLILSHLPDIEYFCEKELENSEYLCRSIDITKMSMPEISNDEEENNKDDSNDDLPF